MCIEEITTPDARCSGLAIVYSLNRIPVISEDVRFAGVVVYPVRFCNNPISNLYIGVLPVNSHHCEAAAGYSVGVLVVDGTR